MVLNIKFALYMINITYLQLEMKNTIAHKAPGLLFSHYDYRGIEMKKSIPQWTFYCCFKSILSVN